MDACKADGTAPEINIQDFHKAAPEVVFKKTKKRKAAAEGPSQRTPKASKKKGNPSSIIVIESINVSTSEAMPSQPENPSPQTFEDFDIGFDPS